MPCCEPRGLLCFSSSPALCLGAYSKPSFKAMGIVSVLHNCSCLDGFGQFHDSYLSPDFIMQELV